MKRISRKIRRIAGVRKINRQLRKVLTVFACIVVFITTYTLILPAITLEKGALICGKEVHEHSDSCYADVLVCTLQESEGHTHNEFCYHTDSILTCEQPEHMHTEECLDEEGNYICGLEEHSHDEDCYDVISTLICDLEESEGHMHTASCYEHTMVCGMEYHIHTASCYTETEPAPEEEENVSAQIYSESDGATDKGDESIEKDEAVNEDPSVDNDEIVEEKTTEDVTGEEESREENSNEDITDEDGINEDTINGDSTGEDGINEDTINEDSTGEDTTDEDTINEDITSEDTTEEEPAESEAAESEPLEEESLEDNAEEESANDDSTEDGSAEEEQNEEILPEVNLAGNLTEDSGLWILNEENAWERIDESTAITPGDNILVRLAYQIPAGSLGNENADTVSYPLPKSLCFSPEKAEYINDDSNYLNQVIAGVRMPEALNGSYDGSEYLAGKYFIESIPTDKVYNKESSGAAENRQDWQLVCSFNEYSIYENSSTDLKGWMMFYLTGADLAVDENGQGCVVFTDAGADGRKVETSYHVTQKKDGEEKESSEPEESPEIEESSEAEERDEAPNTEESLDDETEESPEAEESSAAEEKEESLETEESSEDEETDKVPETEESSEVDEMEEDSHLENRAELYPAQTFEASTGTMNVTVYAGAGAFPAGTTMIVTDVDDEDTVAAIVDVVNDNSEKNTTAHHVIAADITFYDKDGQKIEPLIPIHVAMNPIEVPENLPGDADSLIVHVDDSGNAELIEQRDVNEVIEELREEEKNAGNESQQSDVTEEYETEEFSAEEYLTEESQTEVNLPDDAVVFDADKFSVYALAYTVDFWWTVDGKQYEYSLTGGDAIAFSELVRALHILEDKELGQEDLSEYQIKEFIQNIETIQFSDENLVRVIPVTAAITAGGLKQKWNLQPEYSAELTEEQIEEMNAKVFYAPDWALISMKAFNTDELLIVTMKTGESFSVAVTDAQIKKTIISASGETYEITVTYDDNAGIPDGSDLKVREILPENDEYADYYRSAKNCMNSTIEGKEEADPDSDSGKNDMEYARFFDIEIWNGEEKIEPAVDVSVNIRLMDAPQNTDALLRVVHFSQSGPEVMDVTREEIENEMEEIRFMTDEFSVYSVIYTVDFWFQVNGKEYQLTLPGGTGVSLKELLAQLHIVEKSDNPIEAKTEASDGQENQGSQEYKEAEKGLDGENNRDVSEKQDGSLSEFNADEFVGQISSVVFSDPSLMTVIQVEEEITVLGLKEKYNLNPEYSGQMTPQEIDEYDEKVFIPVDWALLSLKPFTTEETLTITMDDGEVFTIRVTDAQSDASMNPDGTTVQTITNPAGTTIDLFDYWIDDSLKDATARAAWPNFNTYYRVNNVYLNGTGNNKGINSSTDDTTHGHALKFSPANSGTVMDGSLNNWGKPTVDSYAQGGINSWTTGASPRAGLVTGTLVNGYPKLSGNTSLGATDESLAYLFDSSSHDGKEMFTGANNLLYVNPDGFYTFDSNDFNASFNKTTRNFSLTKQTAGLGAARGFWPFGTQKYWLGMHMKTQFSMPADGRVLSPLGNYNDMQFEFQGDDDTWLYVDDVLVGDGGGIHNQTLIRINLRDGTVLVSGEYDAKEDYRTDYHVVSYLDDLYRAAGKYDQYDWVDSPTVPGHKTFAPGTYHTFDMFYLERGGGESNLKIKYNLISTDDFTAHKSYHSKDGSRLYRNDFHFELMGLDGQYQNGELINPDKTAIMPLGGTLTGTGDVGDPRREHVNGYTSYVVGVTEDGNVNFGKADFSSQEMHDCDEGHPSTYRYKVREFVPDDAVNADGKTWAAATEEEKMEGGFKKGDITYDGRVYYMTATVTRWQVNAADGSTYYEYGLSKKYYIDDTYSVQDTNTKFISFVNGYVEPLTLKVNKKGVWSKNDQQQEKDLPGAEFKLTRAKEIDGIWSERPGSESRTAVSGTDGSLSFGDLTEGHYILEETNAPKGYQKPDNKWLITIVKKDTDSKIELVPTITLLNPDGTASDSQETFVISNSTFEKRVDNLRIPRGDITVTKKWLKFNGEEYTPEELTALGGTVRNTNISGQLWRRAEGVGETVINNPKVTLVGKNKNGEFELWSGYVVKNSDIAFSVAVNSTSYPEYSCQPDKAIDKIDSKNITYLGKYNGTKKPGNVFKISNVNEDIRIVADFSNHSNSNARGDNNIGYYFTEKYDADATSTQESSADIDEPAFDVDGSFTLSSSTTPPWTITWSRDDLNEQDDLDYEYYLKEVSENPESDDFTFVEDTTGTVDEETGVITFTHKNTHEKETIDVTVEKEWNPVPDPESGASVILKLRRYAKLTKGTLNLTLVSDLGGAIEGAVFELYKDGTTTGQTFTTDASGRICVTGLEAGEYSLKQISTPENYSMTDYVTETNAWEVKGDLTTPQVHEETLTNKALVTAGSFTIHLTDMNGNPLAGGVFDLYQQGLSTPIVTGLVTDENGMRTRDSLGAGTYYFVQTAAPAGYILSGTTQSSTFTVNEQPGVEQSGSVTMTNIVKAKGDVEITLTNKVNHSAIAGAVFELYKSGVKYAEGTTGSDGTVTFSDLGAGSYTVKQKSSVSGMDISTDEKTFTVLENGNTNQHNSFIFENEVTPGNVTLVLYKTRRDDIYNQHVVSTFTNLQPNTTYQIRIGVPETNIRDGDQAGLCMNFVPGQAPQGVEAISNSAWTSSGNPRYYTITFTPTQNNKTYNIAIVSLNLWGFGDGTSATISNTLSGARNSGTNPTGMIFSGVTPSVTIASGKTSRLRAAAVAAHSDATPEIPTGYGNDTTFEEQTIVLSGSIWTKTIYGLDKYDDEGNLYYYYVVETERTPEDYWVESYSSPVGDQSGTLIVNNKKVSTGSVQITKVFSGDGVSSLPAEFKITASWEEDGESRSTELTTTSEAVTGIGTASQPSTWTIDDIPLETVVTFTETGIQIDGYSLSVNSTAVSAESFSVTAPAVTADQTVSASLVNEYTKKPGSLELTKQVTGNGADTTKTFEFTIELTAPAGGTLTATYPAVHSGDSGVSSVSITDGKVTGILLKAGETFTIKDLPVGTTYRISEADYRTDGYTPEVTNGGTPVPANSSAPAVTNGDTSVTANALVEGVISGGPTEKESVEITNHYTSTELIIKKVDKFHVNDEPSDLLKGASFTLTKYDTEEFRNKVTSWGTNGSKTMTDEKVENGTSDNTSDDISGSDYTLNGTFTFTNLTEGYYKIEEVIMPPGYVKLASDPTFRIKKSDSSDTFEVILLDAPADMVRVVNGTVTLVIGNEPGVALPNTGGPGTRWIYILGIVLVTGTGMLLWRKNRNDNLI